VVRRKDDADGKIPHAGKVIRHGAKYTSR
jgi:hypothetical protein